MYRTDGVDGVCVGFGERFQVKLASRVSGFGIPASPSAHVYLPKNQPFISGAEDLSKICADVWEKILKAGTLHEPSIQE